MGVTPHSYHDSDAAVSTIVKLLERNRERWKAAHSSALTPYTFDDGNNLGVRCMTDSHVNAMRQWFADWHKVLLYQLAIAINIADNVIGKQWLFDWHQNKLQLLP